MGKKSSKRDVRGSVTGSLASGTRYGSITVVGFLRRNPNHNQVYATKCINCGAEKERLLSNIQQAIRNIAAGSKSAGQCVECCRSAPRGLVPFRGELVSVAAAAESLGISGQCVRHRVSLYGDASITKVKRMPGKRTADVFGVQLGAVELASVTGTKVNVASSRLERLARNQTTLTRVLRPVPSRR